MDMPSCKGGWEVPILIPVDRLSSLTKPGSIKKKGWLSIGQMPSGDTVSVSPVSLALSCLKHKPNPVTPQLQLLSPHHPLVSPAL